MVTLKEIEAHAFRDPVTHDKLYLQWLEEHGIDKSGPIVYSLMRYIERLEEQAEPITWTATKPTKPGLYWWRNVTSIEPDDREPTIYKVRMYGNQLAIGNCAIEGWNSLAKGQWSSEPIAEPEEVQP